MLLTPIRDRQKFSPDLVHQPPIDLDAVNSRLLAFMRSTSRDNSISTRPVFSTASSTRSPSPAENFEKRYYYQLQNEGGRPLYPIEKVAEIQKDPDSYRQMLQPWARARAGQPEWHVFEAQLYDWDSFKSWQIHNRRQGHPLTEQMRIIQRSLTRYGVPISFKLLNEPQSQDKLTTWVEYLAYTYTMVRGSISRSQYQARIEWILQQLPELTRLDELDDRRSREQGAGNKNTSAMDEITTDQSSARPITRSQTKALPPGKRARDDGTDEQQPRKRRAGNKNTATIDEITTDQLSTRPTTRSKTKTLPQGKRARDDGSGEQRPRKGRAGNKTTYTVEEVGALTTRRSRRIAGFSPEFPGIA